jgi:hypothetical protein
MPAPYELSVDEFPLLLDSPDEDVTSIMKISRSYSLGGLRTETKLDESTILTMINPYFNFSSTRDANSSATILHPWAGDEEGDTARLAAIWFDSVTFNSLYGNVATYTAYMTRMNFYKPNEPNPFTAAVEKAAPIEEYYANWGYPYLPPAVSFKEVTLPLKVEISVFFGDSESLNNYRETLRKG